MNSSRKAKSRKRCRRSGTWYANHRDREGGRSHLCRHGYTYNSRHMKCFRTSDGCFTPTGCRYGIDGEGFRNSNDDGAGHEGNGDTSRVGSSTGRTSWWDSTR